MYIPVTILIARKLGWTKLAMLLVMALCDTSTPLGLPVVPLEYGNSAVSIPLTCKGRHLRYQVIHGDVILFKTINTTGNEPKPGIDKYGNGCLLTLTVLIQGRPLCLTHLYDITSCVY